MARGRFALLVAVPLTGLALTAMAAMHGDPVRLPYLPSSVLYPPSSRTRLCPTPCRVAQITDFPKVTEPTMAAYERATGVQLERPRVPIVVFVTPTPEPTATLASCCPCPPR